MRSYLLISILAAACGGGSNVTETEPFCSDGVDDDTDCEYPICFEDPACYDFDDPTDLRGPGGDPSLDLDKVRVDLTAGTATFFATTDGTWPPPASIYSWFITFEIDNESNSPVARITEARHDGQDTSDRLNTGGQGGSFVTRQKPEGIWVQITNVPSDGVKFYVESGIQKSNPGTRVTDTVVGAPTYLP